MLRYQVMLSWFFLWGSLWYKAILSLDDIKTISPFPDEVTNLIILLCPLWMLIFLAFYAASCILYGLLTMEDFPQASVELEREIIEAKEDMKKRNVYQ
jgi:Dolichol-phosphate mannosyltransferase subunit 3 (DPM3)